MDNSFVVSTPKISEEKWITDGAWITGLVGCVAVFVVAIVCQQYKWLDNGLTLGPLSLESGLDVQLFSLLLISLLMCSAELIRLAKISTEPFINLAPEFVAGKYLDCFLKTLWRYLSYLALFSLVYAFYRAAGEYGFKNNAAYYQSWFKMCSWLYQSFVWLGFPYVFVTYTFKYNASKENNSYHRLVECVGVFLLAKFKIVKLDYPIDTQRIKKIALGLLVRIFFVPLMTVFFTHHFPHLVKNFGYLFEWLPKNISSGNYTHASFNNDLNNILKPVIFTIDVCLAWCGYVLTSRWLDNETQSAEPTLLGWVVCLISYPPFQLAGLYFYFPSESQILTLDNQYFVSFFSILMLLTFMIYTSSTVVFGVRFSNLTHRGIIRTGPFSIVRHPAYASKNIAWWLGIYPVVLYLFFSGKSSLGFVVVSTIGLSGAKLLVLSKSLNRRAPSFY